MGRRKRRGQITCSPRCHKRKKEKEENPLKKKGTSTIKKGGKKERESPPHGGGEGKESPNWKKRNSERPPPLPPLQAKKKKKKNARSFPLCQTKKAGEGTPPREKKGLLASSASPKGKKKEGKAKKDPKRPGGNGVQEKEGKKK